MKLLLILAVTACGGESPPSGPQGRSIYRESWCVQCHGLDRGGTARAPALRGLGEHWSEVALVRYLENPRAYVDFDPRLRAMSKKYSMVMPRFVMEDETRRALAIYLLATDDP